MAYFQLIQHLWQAKFSNHIKFNLEASICIPLRILKTQFEVARQRYFPVVARLIRHSLFYKGQFSIRWVPLADKLLKSNQTETKNLYLYLQVYFKKN